MPTLRLADSLQDVPADAWDALHDGGNPFVSHAFLSGLEATGCLLPAHGWRPAHLVLEDAGRVRAAAPGYVKGNSHGEFVFDHAWAHAFARHGLDYFPKWLCAVPYSPCTGPRLLTRDPEDRETLVAAMTSLASRANLSSAHVNFHTASEDAAFPSDWAAREDIQYHWTDRGWRDFDDFLDAMDHRHRKNIRQERARVARAGIGLRVVHGEEALPGDIAAMHRFYRRTFDERGNLPALTEAFFHHLVRARPRSLLLVLAERGGRTIAGAMFLRGRDTLHGRYWGADEHVPGLHFEACYYQGIEYCLREGLPRFEPGAQGEHKLSRGFLPAIVRSRHWIADTRFREAIDRWCTEEREAVRAHARRIAAHGPFRDGRAAEVQK